MYRNMNCRLVLGAELQDRKLYRIMNPILLHHGFQWKLGENTDPLPFVADGECTPGGLYFTTIDFINEFLPFAPDLLMTSWLAEVTVALDEQVWQQQSYPMKWKAHRVTVTQMTQILFLPQHRRLSMMLGREIDQDEYDENQEQLCLEAVLHRPCLLELIEPLTADLCFHAVQKSWVALGSIENQTPEIIEEAVRCFPDSRTFIRDPELAREYHGRFKSSS